MLIDLLPDVTMTALQRLQSLPLGRGNVRSGIPKGWTGSARCAALRSAVRPLQPFATPGRPKPVISASVQDV